MANERILVVEDDPVLLRGLTDNFKFKGYHVLSAADGREALDTAISAKPDLMVLDIMLPSMNGYEVCSRLREAGHTLPIVMLTAKGKEEDVVRGLNLGANDYLTKPFSVKELLARVEGMLRRRRRGNDEVFAFGDCEVHLSSCKLFRQGEELALTPKEYGLLLFFIRNVGRALTRDTIMSNVWGADLVVTSRSVDRCINTLRNKVEPDPPHPIFIKTIRDIGYRFEALDTKAEPASTEPNGVALPAKGSRIGGYEVLTEGEQRCFGHRYRVRLGGDRRELNLLFMPWLTANDPALALLKGINRQVMDAGDGAVQPFESIDCHQGKGFVVRRSIDGSFLRTSLNSGKFETKDALDHGLMLCEGVRRLAEAELFHGCLNPDNILVTADKKLAILDFGLLMTKYQVDCGRGETPTFPFTTANLGYLSPELARGMAMDCRSDIYSIGCLLFEMLCGRPPFRADTHADLIASILRDEPAEPNALDCPKSLSRIIFRCLEKQPEKRFQSMQDLAFALEVLAG